MAVVTREATSDGLRAWLRARRWSLAIVPLAALGLILALAGAAAWRYGDRALPGVSVAGTDVGSLTGDAIVRVLDEAVAAQWAAAEIVATADGRTYRATNGTLGIRPDTRAAADAALAYGKRGLLGDRLTAWADALRGQARVPFTLTATGDALERWLAAIAADVERPALSGSLALGARGLQATPPALGRRLDLVTSAATVLTGDAPGERRVALTVRDVYPELDDSGFRDALAVARDALTQLVVVIDERRVTAGSEVLATLVRIDRLTARPGELPAVPAGAIAPAARYRYVVSPETTRIAEWVSALAAKMDRVGSNARYRVTPEGTLAVVPGVTGVAVEQDRLRSLLADALTTPVATSVREIAAPAVRDGGTAFTTAQASAWLPMLARTSTFTTYFPVSASRHANIATGSSQFDGVVIAPGDTFSFWSLLGPVTTERGYAYAGAIIHNRSDENVIGGGLCQVSTTMFNAIARLGYEIVERHEHGYYIERYPIGLDAAVFDPGVDFRWRNDTASPVFLWSWVGDTFVTFDVWGLPTGRTVTFSDPVQTRFVDVPADQPADPAFPAGYAVRGRDVVRMRTVLASGGAVLHQDTFFSRYAPVWGGPPAAGGDVIVR